MPKATYQSISRSNASAPIVWLTGNTGAGKTTLAFGAQQNLHRQTQVSSLHRLIVLDGDEMRSSISTEESLSAEDRQRHNLRVARLAQVLSRQNILVIVAVIAPFIRVRQQIDDICRPHWVYVKRSGLEAPDKPYESPEQPDLVINHDQHAPQEAQVIFLKYLHQVVNEQA